jgi:hypothetical protein
MLIASGERHKRLRGRVTVKRFPQSLQAIVSVDIFRARLNF